MTTAASRLRCFSVLAGLTLAIALACAALPARANGGDSWLRYVGGGNTVTGSGKLMTEARTITGFQAISLRGSMKLVLRQGTRDAVEVRADDNLLPLIETRLVDNSGTPTLEIDMKRNTSFRTHDDVTVTVDVSALHALSVSGSGDVYGDGLKTSSLKVGVTGSGDVRLRQLSADDLTVKVTGSGDVGIAGRSAKLNVAISGSGDVNTHDLESDDVSVSIAGSGDAKVNAKKTLSVSIAGSGDVDYTGDAVLKSSIAGSGSVNKH